MATSTFLDDFMQKMAMVPNDVNRCLRLIRTLDKRAQFLQSSLNSMQGKFLTQLKQLKQKDLKKSQAQLPPTLKSEYQKIVAKQKQLYGYHREKLQIAAQLKSLVYENQQQLNTELTQKMKDKTQEQKQMFRRKKNKAFNYSSYQIQTGVIGVNSIKVGDFQYDSKEPVYCYCSRPSYGEMVACESPYCQKEWFHIPCIEQKNLPQKWYCLDCQKQKDKTRSSTSRTFFVNKQS